MKSIALLALIVFAQISIAVTDIPVIYLNKSAMLTSVSGRKTEKITKLGGETFRFYYKDYLKGEKLQVMDAIAQVITPVYPFAVLVENELYNKDDDNCTKMPDRTRGVDIGQACRNHDYCYYQICGL